MPTRLPLSATAPPAKPSATAASTPEFPLDLLPQLSREKRTALLAQWLAKNMLVTPQLKLSETMIRQTGLAPGKQVTAEVLDATQNGNFRVRILGQTLELQLPPGTKSGQALLLNVLRLKPMPSFEILTRGAQGTTPPREAVALSAAARATLTTSAVMERLPPVDTVVKLVVDGPETDGRGTRARIGQQILTLTTAAPLPKGTVIVARVVADTAGTTALSVLKQTPPAPANHEALSRSWLPQQGSPVEALAKLLVLGDAALKGNNSNDALTARIQSLAAAIAQRIPDADQHVGEIRQRVAEWVQQSGLFLESNLASSVLSTTASAREVLQQDLKSILLRIGHLLRAAADQPATRERFSPPPMRGFVLPNQPPIPLPSNAVPDTMARELSQLTEQTVARLQLAQLAATAAGDTGGLWHLDVPVRMQDKLSMMYLRIEEESGGRRDEQNPAQRRWNILMSFHVEPLGHLQARIALQDQHVSTRIWTTSEEATAKLSPLLPQYRARLEEHGMTVGETACETGAPAPAATSTATPPSGGLINEHL